MISIPKDAWVSNTSRFQMNKSGTAAFHRAIHRVQISLQLLNSRIGLSSLSSRSNRIPFFYYLIQQWSGHISAALALTPKEYVRYSKDFFSFPIPKRVKITLFQLDPSKPFPVNRLRNIAINNIETSHFFYNDIDFVVSGDSSIVG